MVYKMIGWWLMVYKKYWLFNSLYNHVEWLVDEWFQMVCKMIADFQI